MSPSLPPLGADVDAVIFLTPVADEATDAVPVITPESSIWKLFKPGILNLVMDALPNVISLDTPVALGSAHASAISCRTTECGVLSSSRCRIQCIFTNCGYTICC